MSALSSTSPQIINGLLSEVRDQLNALPDLGSGACRRWNEKTAPAAPDAEMQARKTRPLSLTFKNACGAP
jgi:hypothetical protein